MSCLGRFAAGSASSFIRHRCGYWFCGGISSVSSCSLLWRRTITGNSMSGENPNPNPNPNPNDEQSDDPDPSNFNPNSRKQEEAPWLLLSSPTNRQSRYLYDLTIRKVDNDREEEERGEKAEEFYFDKKLNRVLHLPDIAEHIFIGSSEGFLISMNKSADTIHAFNPLTGSHLPLPQLPRRHHKNYSNITEQFDHMQSTFFNLYFTKAILSPSLDTIVILPKPDYWGPPWYAPLPCSSSSPLMWTMLADDECGTQCFEGIFHKGLLHITDGKGDLWIHDLKCNKLADYANNWEPYLRTSLVESPDGNDLFLVHRRIDDDTWFDPRPVHYISVYKLRFNQKKKHYEWDQVKTIGDLAFFVGTKSASVSLDVGDRHLFPSLKPNSVYFSDTWSVDGRNGDGGQDPKRIGEAGVCTLEDEVFHYIELNDGTQLQLNWPPPVWYMPSTSAMHD